MSFIVLFVSKLLRSVPLGHLKHIVNFSKLVSLWMSLKLEKWLFVSILGSRKSIFRSLETKKFSWILKNQLNW